MGALKSLVFTVVLMSFGLVGAVSAEEGCEFESEFSSLALEAIQAGGMADEIEPEVLPIAAGIKVLIAAGGTAYAVINFAYNRGRRDGCRKACRERYGARGEISSREICETDGRGGFRNCYTVKNQCVCLGRRVQ